MLLAPVDAPGGTDAFNGAGTLKLAEAVPLLPKDVIIADWHYGGGYEHFPSFDFWRRNGFRIVAGPWYGMDNVWNITRDAKGRDNVLGLAATTWCGVASEDDAFMRNLQYLGPLVYSADCSWSAGLRPWRDLPYDPSERFIATLTPPAAVATGPGFLVDLQAAGTRTLADPDGTGWLGYGPKRDLSALPTGRAALDRTTFLMGPKAVVLAGTLAPAGLPASVTGIAIGRRAAALIFLHACGWPADPGQQIGRYVVHYADGTAEEVPLVYGRNVAAFTAGGAMVGARMVWHGRTPGGSGLALSALEWRNPHPDREIASLDFASAGTRAAPALIAVTGVAP
jgi:hypothetical protein